MCCKGYHIRYLLFVALILSFLSCSSNNSPEGKVQQFYDLLVAGEFSKAKELYSAETKSTVEKTLPNGAFMKWANEETKQGTIETIKIINSNIRGEGATVNYAIVYKDASTVSRSVLLAREGGIWKMGLILPSFSNAPSNPPAQDVSFPTNQNSSSSSVSSPPTQSGGKAMTTARAQAAVDSAMQGIKKNLGDLITPNARAVVQGVQELQNGARADINFIDTVAVSKSCRLKETWNTGSAGFQRYNDGRWVMTQLQINNLMCESVWTFNFEVK
jgi:hypothetical protein